MARLSKAFRLMRRMVRLQASVFKLPPRPRRVVARPLADPPPPADRVTELRRFGSNPGALRMFVYAPPQLVEAAPLVVVLHGCGQDAASFATHSGWIALARRQGFPLVLPEQVHANHRNRCFNWYRPGDVGQAGESLSIRQMIALAARRFGSDRRRIFVVGLSAGGAMAGAMLAAYPALFAGGAIVAGMPVGAASGSLMALHRMHRADPLGSRAALINAVQAASPVRKGGRFPRISIWQGSADRTVDPANAELLAAQWSGVHGLELLPASDTEPAPGLRRRAWRGRSGERVEVWTLAELAHGYPIDPVVDEGRPGPWVVEAGVSATRRIAGFWGLGDG
ncbi:extracellular catalytic domain type 1 short-chain-length polyhydroxyalkanoate depolymerase [Roseococcus pinisoli]|nr:PHB depolymerase family esterase [Roseococcus pinisoli]